MEQDPAAADPAIVEEADELPAAPGLEAVSLGLVGDDEVGCVHDPTIPGSGVRRE